MKVLPFKIPKPGRESLIYQEDHEQVFFNQLHQHQEIQLSYIVRGSGTLLLADSVHTYTSGDLFVIGSRVPHVFRSDTIVAEKSLMKSLFFDEYSFGAGFFELEETLELKRFFDKSAYGVRVAEHGSVFHKVFEPMAEASKLERFIGLLGLLKILNEMPVQTLSNEVQSLRLSSKEGERLRKVFDYTMKHHNSDISLSEIAEVANMTKTAFCKYFKKRTNKTYNAFLNAYRVEMVIKQMRQDSNLLISQVAYDNGFGSVSNFNKTFKKLKGVAPKTFLNSIET